MFRKVIGMRPFCLILFLIASLPLYAQRRVSADVAVKMIGNGNATNMTKSVYCSSDGRMISVSNTKDGRIFVLTNIHGETSIYNENSKEVAMDNRGLMLSTDELLQIFLLRRATDMGMGAYGYQLTKTTREEQYIKKVFEPKKQNSNCSRVEIVFDEFKPIYCAYFDHKGKIITKVYYSQYALQDRFMFPTRVTEITYANAKDSIVKLDLYTNIQVDQDDPMFDFQVPVDAKVIKMNGKK